MLIQENIFTNDTNNRKIICNKKGKYSVNIFFSNTNANSSQMTVYKSNTVVETFVIGGVTSCILKRYTIDLETNDYISIYKESSGNGAPTSLIIYEDI